MLTLFANQAEIDAHRASLGILLSDGLKSCLTAARELAELTSPAEAGTLIADIAEQLAAERAQLDLIRNREELLLARLEHTRTLALEMRSLESCIRPELDLFRLATSWIADALAATRPDAATQFDAGHSARRFLAVRRPDGGTHIVAGRMPVEALIETCLTVLDALEPLLPEPPALPKTLPIDAEETAGLLELSEPLAAEPLELSEPMATAPLELADPLPPEADAPEAEDPAPGEVRKAARG